MRRDRFFWAGLMLAATLFVGCSSKETSPVEPNEPQEEEETTPEDEEDSEPQTLKERVEALMIKVDGGTFIMGQTTSGLDGDVATKAESDSQDTNDPRPDELPLHKVTLSGFEISKYEVTQGLWKEVMGTLEPCWSASAYGEDDDRAMDGVDWNDANDFIARLNELTGGDWRLPTEAEWEFAARGGNKSKDFRFSGSNDVSEAGWFKEDGLEHVNKVGLKIANELGLYDMSGNAFEWCFDWYGPYSDVDQVNPKGPSDENKYYQYNGANVSSHVLRGGHWQSSTFGLRVSFRTKIPTTNYKPKAGFRIARGISYDEMNYYAVDSGSDSDEDSDEDVDGFEKCVSGKLSYRKKSIDVTSGVKPVLVMYLHGGTSKGDDNESQLKEPGVGIIAEYLASKSISSIFVVPQCPSTDSWGAKMNVNLKSLLDEYKDSCDGVFVLGGSMGGTGTWSLANTYPDMFTGIMPVAGKPGTASADNFKSMRICSVMSEADEVMKTAYEDVRTFCDNVNSIGGNAIYTIIPASEQWSHQMTCEQSYTQERLQWLFGK